MSEITEKDLPWAKENNPCLHHSCRGKFEPDDDNCACNVIRKVPEANAIAGFKAAKQIIYNAEKLSIKMPPASIEGLKQFVGEK